MFVKQNVFFEIKNQVSSTSKPNNFMKRLLPIFIVLTAFIYSCKNDNKSGSSGNKHDLATLIVDTIKVDRTANRDMMIILSILPDSLSQSFKWTRFQRATMRETVEKNGYLIDSNQVFKSINVFNNNHIDLLLPNGKFLLTTYQISDGHYVIVTVETVNERQTVHAYQLYKSSAAVLSLDDLFGKYSLNFLLDPSNQTCLGMLYDKNPNFNFTISDDNKIKIKVTNYDEDNSKGCLKGNLLTLRFNKLQMPCDVESVTWEN
jgi:hypothetical protein